MIRALALTVTAATMLACESDAGGGTAAETAVEPVEPDTPDTVVVVPEYPAPRRGSFVAVVDGQYPLGGSWEARAGLCDDPPMLQLTAGGADLGVIVLLHVPGADTARETSYPVSAPDSAWPVAPAAQIGLQVYHDRELHTFRGDSGMVEVYRFGDRVSARLEAALRETGGRARVGYAAVFERVPVTPLGPERCRVLDVIDTSP